MLKYDLEIIDNLLSKYKVSPLLFWGEYQNKIDEKAEFERAFRLNDAMNIPNVTGAIIDNGYVLIKKSGDDKYTIKVSLRYKKETIIKIISSKVKF